MCTSLSGFPSYSKLRTRSSIVIMNDVVDQVSLTALETPGSWTLTAFENLEKTSSKQFYVSFIPNVLNYYVHNTKLQIIHIRIIETITLEL